MSDQHTNTGLDRKLTTEEAAKHLLDPISFLTKEQTLERLDEIEERLKGYSQMEAGLKEKLKAIGQSRTVKVAYQKQLRKHLHDLGG